MLTRLALSMCNPDGQPHVAGGASASRAADSWNLWRQDVAAIEDLGANVWVLALARVEPGHWRAS